MKSFFIININKIITVILLLTTHTVSAEIYLAAGGLDSMELFSDISVKLDFTETTFNWKKSFNEYLRLYPRNRNWEEQSIDAFYEEFNSRCYNDSCDIFQAKKENDSTKYRIYVHVRNINKNGKITCALRIADITKKEENSLAIFLIVGSDGDVNDKIALRDPMKDAGKRLAIFFKKHFTGIESSNATRIFFGGVTGNMVDDKSLKTFKDYKNKEYDEMYNSYTETKDQRPNIEFIKKYVERYNLKIIDD